MCYTLPYPTLPYSKLKNHYSLGPDYGGDGDEDYRNQIELIISNWIFVKILKNFFPLQIQKYLGDFYQEPSLKEYSDVSMRILFSEKSCDKDFVVYWTGPLWLIFGMSKKAR